MSFQRPSRGVAQDSPRTPTCGCHLPKQPVRDAGPGCSGAGCGAPSAWGESRCPGRHGGPSPPRFAPLCGSCSDRCHLSEGLALGAVDLQLPFLASPANPSLLATMPGHPGRPGPCSALSLCQAHRPGMSFLPEEHTNLRPPVPPRRGCLDCQGPDSHVPGRTCWGQQA